MKLCLMHSFHQNLEPHSQSHQLATNSGVEKKKLQRAGDSHLSACLSPAVVALSPFHCAQLQKPLNAHTSQPTAGVKRHSPARVLVSAALSRAGRMSVLFQKTSPFARFFIHLASLCFLTLRNSPGRASTARPEAPGGVAARRRQRPQRASLYLATASGACPRSISSLLAQFRAPERAPSARNRLVGPRAFFRAFLGYFQGFWTDFRWFSTLEMPIPRFAIACEGEREWRSHAVKRARPEKILSQSQQSVVGVCVESSRDESLKLFKCGGGKGKSKQWKAQEDQEQLCFGISEPQDGCLAADFELGPPPPCPPTLCRQKAMDAGCCPLKQAALSLAKKCAAFRQNSAATGGASVVAPPTACFARLSLSRTRSRPADS